MTELHRCIYEGELSELKTNVRTIFKRIDEMRNIYDNLSKLTDSVHNLTVNMSVFAEQMRDTKDDLNKIRNDLEYMKSIPVNDFKDTKKAFISAIIGVIVGVLSSMMFNGF